MIIGIGLDLIEIERVKKAQAKQEKFVKRILTEKEYSYYQKLAPKRQLEYLSGRFAAKEAYSKAIGSGLGELSFQHIEILNDEAGKPMSTMHPENIQVWISITHTEKTAAAQVILERI